VFGEPLRVGRTPFKERRGDLGPLAKNVTTATAYALLTGIALGLLGLAGIAGALLMSAAATVAYRGGLQPRWTVVLVVVGAVVAAIGTWVFFFRSCLWSCGCSSRRLGKRSAIAVACSIRFANRSRRREHKRRPSDDDSVPVTLLDRAIVRPLLAVPTPDVRRDRAVD
jgi:hypothetical protein